MTTEERKAEDARFRQEYPLFAQYPELIYLDNAATTQKPSCVIQAESAFYEKYNANPFRGVYELAEFATEHYEEARAAVAELLHANTDEIVFTRNASESLNFTATCLYGSRQQSALVQHFAILTAHRMERLPPRW